MKRWFGALLLAWLGSAAALAASPQAVVFMYHRFGEDRFPSTSIRLAQFRAQLDLLEREGFRVLSLAEVVAAIREGRMLPDKAVAITIDDAYLSVYRHAYPLLRERGWPFTVFVATRPVDRGFKSYMSWAQMREMREHGVSFANHSRDHGHLTEVAVADPVRRRVLIREELLQAQQRLREELGEVLPFFAYPYGEYDPLVAEVVAELGWVGFGQQSGAFGPSTDLRVVPRFPVSDWYGELKSFATKAASLPLPLAQVTPFDPVLRAPQPPSLRVSLARRLPRQGELRCYASHQGEIEVRWLDDGRSFEARAPKPFGTRRGRYNCTVPSLSAGRYYWFSHLWIQPWLAEE